MVRLAPGAALFALAGLALASGAALGVANGDAKFTYLGVAVALFFAGMGWAERRRANPKAGGATPEQIRRTTSLVVVAMAVGALAIGLWTGETEPGTAVVLAGLLAVVGLLSAWLRHAGCT